MLHSADALDISLLVLAVSLASTSPGDATTSGDTDAEVRAFSQAYSAWVDVSHNIACPALIPRVDALTKRLGDIQDVFLARHPDSVFPPMIFASTPFVDCADGVGLVARAEERAAAAARLLNLPG